MTSFTITCTTAALSVLGSASVRACLKIGTGSTGSTLLPTRSMTNASADPMAFQLYTNAGRTTVWGTVPAGTPPAAVVTLSYGVPLLTGGSGAQYRHHVRAGAGRADAVGRQLRQQFHRCQRQPGIRLQREHHRHRRSRRRCAPRPAASAATRPPTAPSRSPSAPTCCPSAAPTSPPTWTSAAMPARSPPTSTAPPPSA